MRHNNTLHTCCPYCGIAFALDKDNIRQADFKRKFGKYDYVTKSGVENALDGLSDDQGQEEYEENEL